ncbi:hypothetical protein HN858_04475 [Candidatus Falkowbacteria bacterium]|nr:hypothetical protein [Candidatus Falkowbacteria bacterium]MBT5503841.1 hypothetical protein [Candidatus Falkowbacteria bacterium]MBT6574384.1 hypothetical protein [Candidatus Falkowbacteria bacterium]MBT7348900.1 hypothetical protein [Candidatus Falkowbacteria bacterium]
MEYTQSSLDKLKVFIKGKEVFGALFSAIIVCFISLVYLPVEELRFQESNYFPFVMIGVVFVVWCILKLLTRSVRAKFWRHAQWVQFALFDKGKFVATGKGFVLRDGQEAIHFMMPRDWKSKQKQTTGGRSIKLLVKGLPVSIFFKVTLHFTKSVNWQAIYTWCNRYKPKAHEFKLPFTGLVRKYDVGGILGELIEEVLESRRTELQNVMGDYLSLESNRTVGELDQLLIDQLDTSAMRIPGVERVEVSILREDEKQKGQCPYA